jgi:hypothetical protein
MGRKTSGGWLILGLIGLGLFRCGDTKTPTPPSTAYSPPPSATQGAPVQAAYSPTPAQPLTAPRSTFTEPIPNGYRGVPAAETRPIKRSLYVRGKDVPMRAEPNANAKILNRLPNGMEVGELSRREGWVEIRHPISAAEGWVSARRLDEVAPQTEEQPKPKRKEPPGIEVLSDAAIIAKLIALDAASYSGNCRCPENTDRAGRRCGARSAYSKPGGREPLCYVGDVTPKMIANFRATSGR